MEVILLLPNVNTATEEHLLLVTQEQFGTIRDFRRRTLSLDWVSCITWMMSKLHTVSGSLIALLSKTADLYVWRRVGSRTSDSFHDMLCPATDASILQQRRRLAILS